MFEVETAHLLARDNQKEKGSSKKAFIILLMASLGLTILVMGTNLISRQSKSINLSVPTFTGTPKTAEEIIHYSHYLSIQLSQSNTGVIQTNFLSQFIRAYRSIRSEKLSAKDKENLDTLEDIVNVLEQRDAVPEDLRLPSAFWEKVMPVLAITKEMVSNPSITNMKTYPGKLAHSNPQLPLQSEMPESSIKSNTESRTISSNIAATLFNNIQKLTNSRQVTSEFLVLVDELLDQASQTDSKVLSEVQAASSSPRSSAVATLLSKTASIAQQSLSREGLRFLLAFELGRLATPLNAEHQLLCRAVETVAQNWARYRYLKRETVDKALDKVYPQIANRKAGG
jgi:flagellar basal body-associated protein FliL